MKKAQATLEYIIIVCAVVGALIAAGVYVQNSVLTPITLLSILQRAVPQPGTASASVPTSLTKLVPGWSNLYGYAYDNGFVSVGPYEKYYFVVDPMAVGYNPASVLFWIITRGPTSNNNMSARIITVEKSTGRKINDTGNQLSNNRSPNNWALPYNSNYAYIIELTENQGKATSMDLCWRG